MAQILAFIGYGEAGRAFATSIRRDAGGRPRGFDCADKSQAMTADDVDPAETRGSALHGAAAAWCLVTADRAHEAAVQCAPSLTPGTLWFDGNSCSPGAKQASSSVIDAAGGRYVDVAIMAPVHPLKAGVPLLVSGPWARDAARLLTDLGMKPVIVGDRVGQASTIKMMRSVMIKGIEALTAECVLAARRAGVEDAVLASLQKSDPGFDWTARSAYNLERMAVHGARRSAEMVEVAKTLRELGFPDRMAAATAQWQAQIAALHLAMPDDETLVDRADRILAALSPK